VVYTKPWVVDLILDLAGYTSEADLGAMLAVEPVAGDGSFLIAMVERVLTSCRHHVRPVTEC
jgi:adenine-specific DNA-methyltransferase